jgi:hypothetical protein
MAEIERLPGAPLTAEVLLHQVLENRPAAVVIIELDENDHVMVRWSTMEAMKVVYCEKILNLTIAEYMRDPSVYTEQEESPPA